MRQGLPTGTVTFVFTDIEGSTRLLEELGAERYGELLAQHHRVCRVAWAEHGGVEVDTAGDAFFVAFPTVSGALAGARSAQEALAELGLQVRMGVHTGEVSVNETGYVGLEVHRAARIAAAAHGGQVVVSAATAALTSRDGLVDLGDHRFKDLAAPERVFQFGEGEFPLLKSLYQSNLPVPATPFVGRERDVASVAELLCRDDVRIVTLTGPGGIGKTRLALQAAGEASDRFPDGVWWVALAALRDAGLFLSAVAQTLDVTEAQARTLRETLARRLAGKKLLLLVDNVEHLLPAVAHPLVALRDDATTITLLVTSRERLQVSGEHAVPVDALPESDAIELFTAHAARLGVDLEADGAVRELCLRLECLPLALELAAARSAAFTPQQLLDRLARRLDLLKGPRDVDPRQQTLRATLEWSYDLLDSEEKVLFERLAVFRGGAVLEAVNEVTGADLDTLEALVDRSLVRRRVGRNREPRYWMLETIREFAWERLAVSEDRESLHRVHAEHFATKLASQSVRVRRHDEHARATALDDLDNGRAALEWAFSRGESRVAARIVWGLWFIWLRYGHGREATEAANRLLELDLDPDDANSFFGALAASEVLRFTGHPERALAVKRHWLGVARQRGDLELFGEVVSYWSIPLLSDIASLECDLGDLESARRHAEEALAQRRELGRPAGIAHALLVTSEVAMLEGRADVAVQHLEEALARYASAGETAEAVGAMLFLADARLARGDLETAVVELRDALEASVGDVYLLADAARIVADVAARRSRLADSARLAGFHAETIEQAGLVLGALERSLLEAGQRPVRAALGPEYEAVHDEGRQLATEPAIELALDVLSEP